jgi:hypothetical protein
MKNICSIFSGVIVVLILGFSSELSIVSADQNIMQQKCTKCHSLRIPDNYTKKEWKYNVERMAKRAGLTQQEIQSIIDLNKKN